MKSAGSHKSDQRLLKQIANGNELAFSQLYTQHWDSLFIAAHKMLKDEELCKDIVQEVFLKFLEKSDFENINNLEAYLHQSVKYRVLMTLRKDRISNKHLETLRELVSNITEEQLEFEEMSETIEHSISSLPVKCQEVFRLSRTKNLPNSEIAERLNISIRTVETHISNALRKIRSSLDSSTVVWITFLLAELLR